MLDRKETTVDDKPKPRFTHSDMMRSLRPDLEQVYTGPYAYTAAELAEMHKEELGHLPARSTATSWANAAVERGEYVRVQVMRKNSNNIPFTCAAWVLKAVYDEWKISQMEPD
jgi:hypothetical protein